jgi:hypothetical protein
MSNQEQVNNLTNQVIVEKESWNTPQLETIGVELTQNLSGLGIDSTTSSAS